MRGGHGAGIASNPVLIGAATLLVTIVAMFLSYNANSGLPFVPTYALTLEAETATNVNKGNEVRIGGARVGVVSEVLVERDRATGENRARLKLKLDKIVQPLPKDSTFSLRPKSLLGLKYVDIVRGRSQEGYEDGAVVPASANRPEQVELDELADTFDAPTRRNQQVNLEEFGNALAGRGSSINQAIGELRPLLRDVVPVMRYLRDPDTGLSRLVRELGDAARIVAPVAERQASLFVHLDRTFAALREVRPQLQGTIEEGPATLDTAIRSFRVQRPFLANTEGLMAELRPGVRALRGAVPDLSAALRAGTPVLRRSVDLSRRTEDLLGSLRDFAEDPVVRAGVAGLTTAVRELRPTLEFAAPSQTTCNYLALWMRNVSSLLSEGDASGTWQRFIIISTPLGPDNEGGPSSRPANGPAPDNYLHANPYPHSAAPGEPRECEAANEPFLAGRQVIGNVEGTQPARTEGNP